MVEKLEPPEKWAHLEFHWITNPHGNQSVWQWLRNIFDPDDGCWLRTGDEVEHAPSNLWVAGFRYHKPADPNAITLDPDGEGFIEAVTRGIATFFGCIGHPHREVCGKDEDCLCRKQSHAVIAEIMKGRGG